jgi:AcrR family transcriptional regulator
MKSASQQRYYEKNKEELKARMRERDAIKREQLRQYLAANPADVEVVREKMREKYYKTASNKVKREIMLIINSTNTSDAGKAFLRECLIDKKYTAFTPKMIESIKVMYAVNAIEQLTPREIDGYESPREAFEGEEASQEEGEEGVAPF